MSKGIEIRLVKDPQGKFHPFGQSDEENAKKIPVGDDTVFRLQRIRNPFFHRKYWALIKLAYENQDTYTDMDVFRKSIQSRAGYIEPMPVIINNDQEKAKFINWVKEVLRKLENNEPISLPVPKSISYGELDQTQFEELYSKVLNEVYKLLNVVKDEDKEMFEAELAGFC